jgi:hypothetical protein
MKRQKKPAFVSRKKSDSEWVNFVALVAGMVTTLVLATLAWSHFSNTDSIDPLIANARYERLNPTQKQPNKSQRGGSLIDLSAKLQDAPLEKLEELLIEYNNWNRTAPAPIRVEQNRKRIRVANEMMQRALEPEQRELVIGSKIEAQSSIYGLEFIGWMANPELPQNDGVNLRATAERFINDPNGTISLAANLAILKVDTFEFIRKPTSDGLDEIVDKMVATLRKYPENDFVRSNLKLLVDATFTFRKGDAIDLTKKLISRYRAVEKPAPETAKLLKQLEDQVILSELQLDEQINGVWANGEQGQRDLFETALKLAANRNGGELLARRADQVARWFEQENQYERATKIFQALADSADRRDIVEAAVLAQQLGKQGLKRCQLVGKRLDLNGRLLGGETLNPELYQNKIVAVIYWSSKNPDSVNALKAIHAEMSSLRTQQVRVLAVCTDSKLASNIADIVQLVPLFQVIVGQSDGSVNNAIIDQCPTSITPHVVLVNHLGVVTDANVPLIELNTSIEELAAKQLEAR